MEINDFSDLTQFVEDEYLKSSETFGTNNPSKKLINMLEKELIKYSMLYSKPIFNAEKRKIALQEALNTMPHGKIWRFFHPSLWRQIEEYNKTKDSETNKTITETTISLVPTVLKPMEVVTVDEEEKEE